MNLYDCVSVLVVGVSVRLPLCVCEISVSRLPLNVVYRWCLCVSVDDPASGGRDSECEG